MSILKKRTQMPRAPQPAKAGSVMAAYEMMKRARRRSKDAGIETKGYEESQVKVEQPEDKPRMEPESLQKSMVHEHPSDQEDRSKTLFDGEAERIDPLKKEYRENESSNRMGRTDLQEDDSAAEDIVSRIMKKMRRK